ncbi:hypothetical protein CspeluHIS016_0304650 [Cutaneotrichosporon spelunceum]|uniref:BTB domain-containing protein n=1 Tax=Cutaneotrichosporon spelunceum TaxID=1672016 RepID=A0AAD3TTK0_9TREE|nr:hypothetical protein CspeluHIS016_0304650 [Cutaneotrichosporon spelunceum]
MSALPLERAVEHFEPLVEPATPSSKASTASRSTLTLSFSPSKTSRRCFPDPNCEGLGQSQQEHNPPAAGSPGHFYPSPPDQPSSHSHLSLQLQTPRQPRSQKDLTLRICSDLQSDSRNSRDNGLGLSPLPTRQRAVSSSTLCTPTPTASFFPNRQRIMSTFTPLTGSDASHRDRSLGLGMSAMGPPPIPPSSESMVGSSAGRHTREASGRHRTASVVSLGLGHAREPSMGYHVREPSGRSQYDHSRRPSQAVPLARRNSRYGYNFGRRESVVAPPPVVDDKYWVEGDFEIISADSVRFRVPSYYLFAASAVFRGAGALDPGPGRQEIEMLSGMDDIDDVDPQPLPGVVHARYLRLSEPTETAAVLRLFLAFVSAGHLTIPDDGTTLDSLELLRALILFLTKYECEGTLSLALTVLREAVRMPSSVSPLAAFVAGASAGDAFTCSVALDVTDWTWRMMDRHELPAAPDANVFDPHNMPVAVWQLIPPMYTWALTTAWSGDSRNARREDEYDDAAARRSTVGSRCDSTLGRRVHAWQQWL